MAPTAPLEACVDAAHGSGAAARTEPLPPAASRPGSGKFAASQQAEDSTTLFEKEWALYQKVLLGDYLFHGSTYDRVQAFLAERFGGGAAAGSGGGLRILDLGCGDAHCISRALEASGVAPRVASYTGVDMSAPAIEVARGNLGRALAAAPAAAAAFHQGDMVQFCAGCEPGAYDIVFASLSLHHLPAGQKREVLQAIGRRVLAPGGAFVLVDIFYRDAAESREEYMTRFKEDIDTSYELLTAAEKQSVLAHVLGFDYPWYFSDIQAWAAEAEAEPGRGLPAPFAGPPRELYSAKFFKAVALERAP